MEQTWEITDADGGNRRTVTLAQYRAELDAARKVAMANARRMYGDAVVDGIAAHAAKR